MNSARRLIYSILFLAIAAQAQTFAQDKSARIDELMKSYNALGQFNGSVLVAENGRVIYKKGLGMANMEWDIPNTTDTKFRLGSITKQFTAALILQLAEQGKIKLDGKLTDYLPDYRRDTGDRVTIHHLLTHTSGIPSYTNRPRFLDDVARNPYTVADFVKKYASGDLEFEPGSKFSYNNSGYFLLGAIVEKITGKPYEQVVKENIFVPLGMNNSGYDHASTVIPKRASGYAKTPAGYVNSAYLDMSIPYAAGSLYSTVEDMYLWDQALYTDKIISAKSRELMFTPNLEKYGYGFGIDKVSYGPAHADLVEVSHTGGIPGFNTIIVRLVNDKNLIVLLDNTSGGRNLGPISKNIANILYGQPVTPPKRPVSETLSATVFKSGAEAAVRQYRDIKARSAAEYDLSENELNSLGYQLIAAGKPKEAIEIFKLNVEMFPASSNPRDSLGEAYAIAGEKALAIENYKKAVELDPKNANAAAALKRLEAPAVTLDPKTFDQYVGNYQLAPGFVLAITKEGDKLFAQATGQPKIELQPLAEGRFVVQQVNAEITFVKDASGAINGLTLNPGGRDTPAKRVS
jgi:CubicO group peptidase (beta-lactamase class C family)